MIKIIIICLLLTINIILYTLVNKMNKKEKYTNESIFNLASTINLNNVRNKYYDNNTSSYIIYEEQNKFMNNACISGNCLDFNEYNKLKNINNNIIPYDVSINEISGNIIINQETQNINTIYNNIINKNIFNKDYLYNSDYKIYRINRETSGKYNDYINNFIKSDANILTEDQIPNSSDFKNNLLWVNVENDKINNLQLNPNGLYYNNLDSSYNWIPLFNNTIPNLKNLLHYDYSQLNNELKKIRAFAITRNICFKCCCK